MTTGYGLQPSPADTIYLSSVSPRDKIWDKRRAEADAVKNLYKGTIYDCYAERIAGCSGLLEFTLEVDPETGVVYLKLGNARFCRVRHCVVCQWRRQLIWRARFFIALPKILKDYPKARFIFLTLTVRNCPVTELRETLTWMNKSWVRLTQRKQFPALGWLKTVEVTRSIIGEAHPHFHVILMVNPSYFTHKYLSKEKWIALWKESLRVDYDPSVHVSVIKSSPSESGELNPEIAKGFCETLKYSLKPEDLLVSQDWLVEITTQLKKTRAVATGGIFKKYISDKDPEDLITESEDLEQTPGSSLWFIWREATSHYFQVDTVE